MRTTRILLPLVVTSAVLGLGDVAPGQEAAPNPPVATPAPSPVAIPGDNAASPNPPYPLDLPDLHSQNGLFPNGARPSPTPTNSARGNGRSQRNKFTNGTKQRGRSLDRTMQRADADPLDVRVAYRRAKTEAIARDPELVDLLRRADGSGTDTQKRGYLHEYYTRLFASIRRIDSSPAMRSHVDLLAQVAAQQYDPKRRVVAGEEDLLNGRDVGRGWLGR